ncbi:RimJ/RimL family protein N-acetyltransferase [Chryseomicrobium aureum]|uniref:GNAT family N-acetyltransferase n=1 Tax=Chryseomicrobium aureum TaxID=1441723 RepID=UPI00195B7460|nr:GNAT family protein [Chryseomicrobium aureum]MBM7706576.1 RimJ/RimL family protein N-acetyltransferase [Chryseomicrobium aureum]
MIRLARPEDAEAMVAIQKEVLTEEIYFVSTIDEFHQTVEGQREWIQAKQEHPNEVLFVAEKDGEVVGWLVFQTEGRIKVRHTGKFGVMIKQEARGQGYGKQLVQGLIDWAHAHPVIEKISLFTFATNTRAIALYKQLGFVEEGRKLKEYKLADGTYLDDVLMAKFV